MIRDGWQRQPVKLKSQYGIGRARVDAACLRQVPAGLTFDAIETMQTYHTGEEVRLGDIVRWPDDEGRIVALENDLPAFGLTPENAAGKAMIEFKGIGLVCEETAAEDLRFMGRAGKRPDLSP